MTITREPLYEDAPAGSLAALGRHVVAWLASIGQAVRLMVESFAYLPGTIFRGRGRGEFVKQLYSTGIRTLPGTRHAAQRDHLLPADPHARLHDHADVLFGVLT